MCWVEPPVGGKKKATKERWPKRDRAHVRKKGRWNTQSGEELNPTEQQPGQAGEATDAAKLTKRRWGGGREVGWGPSGIQPTH